MERKTTNTATSNMSTEITTSNNTAVLTTDTTPNLNVSNAHFKPTKFYCY